MGDYNILFFEIKNSQRILTQIQIKIAAHFKKKFTQNDSIIIFELSKSCKMTTYGYAKNNDSDLLII